MVRQLLEKHGAIEAFCRCTLDSLPKLKKILKHKRKAAEPGARNETAWNTYTSRVCDIVGTDSIVLIHSSMANFAAIGISEDDMMDLLIHLVERGNTVVLPAFPITNLKKPTAKTRPYDPKKTLCWTGMLPNKFIAYPGVKRSVYPFNSLAAMGPETDKMLEHNQSSVYVYDKNSAWAYCVEHHAKILFIGAQAHSSNTVGIHMVPDVMGDDWPIDDWYEECSYLVKIDGQVSEHTVRYQAGKWYKYVAEYATNKFLRDYGILKEEHICGCYLGSVSDSQEMVDALVARCRSGELMYCIPRKYYKKRK